MRSNYQLRKTRFISVPAMIIKIILVETQTVVKWTELDKYDEHIKQLLFVNFTSSCREDRDPDYVYIDMDLPIFAADAKSFIESYNKSFPSLFENQHALVYTLETYFAKMFPGSNPSVYIPPKPHETTPEDFRDSGLSEHDTYDEYVYSHLAENSSPRFRKMLSRRTKSMKKPATPEIDEKSLQCKDFLPVQDLTPIGIPLSKQQELDKQRASSLDKERVAKDMRIVEESVMEIDYEYFQILKQTQPIGFSDKLKMYYTTFSYRKDIVWLKVRAPKSKQ